MKITSWRVTLVGCLWTPAVAPAQELPGPPPPSYTDVETDRAVRRALDYLEGTQEADGAWKAEGFGPATSVTSRVEPSE